MMEKRDAAAAASEARSPSRCACRLQTGGKISIFCAATRTEGANCLFSRPKVEIITGGHRVSAINFENKFVLRHFYWLRLVNLI
jgi:hypothetical protein